jgi:hypothetical protein
MARLRWWRQTALVRASTADCSSERLVYLGGRNSLEVLLRQAPGTALVQPLGSVPRWSDSRGWPASGVTKRGKPRPGVTVAMGFKIECVREWGARNNNYLASCLSRHDKVGPTISVKSVNGRGVMPFENPVNRPKIDNQRTLLANFQTLVVFCDWKVNSWFSEILPSTMSWFYDNYSCWMLQTGQNLNINYFIF